MYPLLAFVFFGTLIVGVSLIFGLRSRLVIKAYAAWLILYGLFIIFGTGPVGTRLYDPPITSPYKLPWKAGDGRFVSQGNRSFTSHRDQHLYAWDFWMPIGTEILASRDGEVSEIEDQFDGIGLKSNYIIVSHSDGTRAMYAHIKKKGSAVKLGSYVKQGQLIAYSGMVGQTINPHLHFVVLDKEGKTSLPITFSDVPEGVPYAGRFYTSHNLEYNSL